MTGWSSFWSVGAALVLLVAVAVATGAWAALGQARSVATASFRALVQLLTVGVVVVFVLRTPALAPAYLAVMLTAAAWTSGRRLHSGRNPFRRAALAIGTGAGTAAIIIFGCGALPLDTRNLVPLVAQLIGGAMTATTLAGQRLIDEVTDSWDQVEAWLALGATPAQAVREPSRRAASKALIPALDQTRNVGLVVLPGAYVGLLLAGATPVEAGRVQLLVLVGLLAAETVAAVLVTRLLGRDLAAGGAVA